jgi:SOS-response transcriptional repressor LexA
MSQKLTQTQQQMLAYLKQQVKDTGLCPSLRTAAARLGISYAAVAQTLKTLEDKSYIRREGRYSRTLHILEDTGEIDVALIHHEEATVKRFFLLPCGIELRPENPDFTHSFNMV